VKKKGVRLTSKEVKNTVMFREGFTNDMGCKGWNGVGILSEVDGLMGAEQYVAILKGYLQQSMEKSGIPTDNVCIERIIIPSIPSEVHKIISEARDQASELSYTVSRA